MRVFTVFNHRVDWKTRDFDCIHCFGFNNKTCFRCFYAARSVFYRLSLALTRRSWMWLLLTRTDQTHTERRTHRETHRQTQTRRGANTLLRLVGSALLCDRCAGSSWRRHCVDLLLLSRIQRTFSTDCTDLQSVMRAFPVHSRLDNVLQWRNLFVA